MTTTGGSASGPGRTTARESILSASIEIASTDGLNKWTVDAVARLAGCAKGLVNYHFKTKRDLLRETADTLDQQRINAMASAAVRTEGVQALEALWHELDSQVGSGQFSAWAALRATEPRPPRPRAQAHHLREALATALGAPLEALPATAALIAALEGVQLLLATGVAPAEAREAFDRLWLGLLA